MKVATADIAFFGSFAEFFPGLALIKDPKEVENYDLVIFTGGADVDPTRYGQVNTYSYPNPSRDEKEFQIMKQAINLSKKILGVCRGHQMIAVGYGGTLYQDIGKEIGAYHGGYHKLDLVKDHPVMTAIPTYVNSLHHQGIKELGSNFDIVAQWQGVPEVIVSKDNNIIGVQFHPEFMGLETFFDYIKLWAKNSNETPLLGG